MVLLLVQGQHGIMREKVIEFCLNDGKFETKYADLDLDSKGGIGSGSV